MVLSHALHSVRLSVAIRYCIKNVQRIVEIISLGYTHMSSNLENILAYVGRCIWSTCMTRGPIKINAVIVLTDCCDCFHSAGFLFRMHQRKMSRTERRILFSMSSASRGLCPLTPTITCGFG